jgi:DNA-damage-inducible protein J
MFYMAQQINVNIRMDKDTKERADALFNALGFNLTTAINTFVKQALREQAIPFQPKLKRQPLDNNLEQYHTNNLEAELRKAWIEKLNNAILLSSEEELFDISRSTVMHEPVNLTE